MKSYTSILFAFICFTLNLQAATIESAVTGDWDTGSTWVGGVVPLASDDVIIKNTHIVTKSGAGYTHTGNLNIEPNGELIADCGNSSVGFVFDGGEFHVFGTLTFTFPDKDFLVTGNSFFWGHPSAVIYVSDDWEIAGNSTNIVEGICVEVDDDFHINGTNTTLCGSGSVSIGVNSGANTYDLNNGATNAQVCQETGVYRGAGGGACSTLEEFGTGNNGVIAINDIDSTNVDVAITIDVLDLPASGPDNDPDSDPITLTSVGVGYSNDQMTKEGGTVTINNNGTPLDPSDDFLDYTPPLGYTGFDDFIYVVTDGNGGYDWATVTIEIQAPLPIELYDFNVSVSSCTIDLNWITASELNNDYFEIQRSADGINYESIGSVPGAGTANSFRNYSFEDRLPLQGLNYYRIKQVDFNRDFSFSPIEEVASPCNKESKFGLTTVFPNPISRGTLTVIYEGETEEQKLVQLTDIYGKVIAIFEQAFNPGRNYLQFETDEFETGTYLISIGNTTTKFIKTDR